MRTADGPRRAVVDVLLGGADLHASSSPRAASTGARSTSPRSRRRTGSRASGSPTGPDAHAARPLPARALHVAQRLLGRRADGHALRRRRSARRRRAINPFVAGNRRDRRRRGWTVDGASTSRCPPSARAPNTLYAQPHGDAPIELAYRVYEPDRGRDLTGGTGLPASRTSPASAINDPNRDITVQTIEPELWRAGTACRPGHPAFDPVRWERFFNIDYATLRGARGLHGRGLRGAADAVPRAAGRLLLQPRLGVRLRPPLPAARRGRGASAASCPATRVTRDGRRRMGAWPAALLVAVHRGVAGDHAHARLPCRPPARARSPPRVHRSSSPSRRTARATRAGAAASTGSTWARGTATSVRTTPC